MSNLFEYLGYTCDGVDPRDINDPKSLLSKWDDPQPMIDI